MDPVVKIRKGCIDKLGMMCRSYTGASGDPWLEKEQVDGWG